MPKKVSSPHKSSGTTKYILEKIDEHDKLLQDIFQCLRDIKKDLNTNNQQFMLEYIQQFENEEEDDEEPDEANPAQ
jgi:hypothetical protein